MAGSYEIGVKQFVVGRMNASVEFGPQGVVVDSLLAGQGVKDGPADEWRHAEPVMALPWQQNKADPIDRVATNARPSGLPAD